MKRANCQWPRALRCRLLGVPLALLLWACAQTPSTNPPQPPTPAPAPGSAARNPGTPPGALYSLFHRPLQTPPAGVEVLRLKGAGAQIFRCEAQSAGLRWSFRLPEAELRDAQGKVVVHYGANLSFEHVDGSLLVGEVIDHVPSPDSDALPWLLLKTRSFHDGALVGITYVERINTVGGMPPAACTPEQVNELLRVPFSADFVFFR